MSDEVLALYEAAVDQLPPLTRLVFLLHRVDDLSYREIAARLTIDVRAVECCIAEALVMIGTFVDGDTPRRWRRKPLAQAEMALHQRHRAYCDRKLRFLRIRVAWDDDDDDQAIDQAMEAAMPPRLRAIVMLHREHMTPEAIADRMKIGKVAARWWLFCLGGYFALWPKLFDEWLCWTATRQLRR